MISLLHFYYLNLWVTYDSEGIMKFYEKYPQLRDRAFLSKTLERTLYATMALENQEVSKEKIALIVAKTIDKRESENPDFFTNKVLQRL